MERRRGAPLPGKDGTPSMSDLGMTSDDRGSPQMDRALNLCRAAEAASVATATESRQVPRSDHRDGLLACFERSEAIPPGERALQQIYPAADRDPTAVGRPT
jgi:hypothetical protein